MVSIWKMSQCVLLDFFELWIDDFLTNFPVPKIYLDENRSTTYLAY